MPNLPAWKPATIIGQESSAREPIYQPANAKAGTGDARNWLRWLVSLVARPAGRSAVLRTDVDLQTGPSPLSIRRTFSDLSGGYIDGHGSRAWPTTGGESYIPHLNIVKANPAGKATPYRSVDDATVIPAIYTGAPSL